ncbi:uracil-DNA glycosylase [Bradyrhizobium sp. WSM 1791]|uniref:Uracil-DNA glycosylase n=2 Tax=Bradyrhizobium australiense TaxID=2721161 RepID=A0A7Y4LVM2_9BRAD|nr:uracil-DNA glycosylase [Bradyrhizobium australiense]
MGASRRILGRSSGDLSALMMFVGEAPGRLGADDTAIPFHGDKAGENFEKLIAQVGISRYDFFITNAVLCNPKDENGNNATPTKREVANCSGFLRRQIAIIQPRIVVTLGNQALQALKYIEDHSCELSADVRTAKPWHGRILIPLYHPGQRALLHRSFLNQLADYRFVAEQYRKLVKPARKAVVRAPTRPDVANLASIILRVSGSISYFRLHKLFYLVEYHHCRSEGRRLTASYAIRQKDGPYFTDLHLSKLRKAIPGLAVASKNERLMLALEDPADFFERPTDSVDSKVESFVSDVVSQYRDKSDEQLKTVVYLTAPMRSMLRKERYGGANLFNAPINFSAMSAS